MYKRATGYVFAAESKRHRCCWAWSCDWKAFQLLHLGGRRRFMPYSSFSSNAIAFLRYCWRRAGWQKSGGTDAIALPSNAVRCALLSICCSAPRAKLNPVGDMSAQVKWGVFLKSGVELNKCIFKSDSSPICRAMLLMTQQHDCCCTMGNNYNHSQPAALVTGAGNNGNNN